MLRISYFTTHTHTYNDSLQLGMMKNVFVSIDYINFGISPPLATIPNNPYNEITGNGNSRLFYLL